MRDRDAPPTRIGTKLRDGKLYVLETTARHGVKEPLSEAHPTPGSAYRSMVRHAGEEPPDGEPDWPDEFGDKLWGWKPSKKRMGYYITEWEWAGVEGEERDEWPTADELQDDA